jgi:putative colanic acid biosysnthesis UDP-glucose lipid carrier transferase
MHDHPAWRRDGAIERGALLRPAKQESTALQTGPTTKRCFDVLASLLLLLLFLPVLAIISSALRLESGSPVLFRQKRGGLAGRPFVVVKFRTMKVLEDGPDLTQATRDDPRVTRLGAFLRRTSLDELPQLWNVLRGDMSLVGPRPHAVAHDQHYAGLIRRYPLRHRVRPGITGLAQVGGLRGETATVEAMADRVEADIRYIENWSFWGDIRILLSTLRIVFFDRSAY